MEGNIDSDDSDLEFEATDNITDTEDFVEEQDEEDSDFEGDEGDEDDAGDGDGEEEILYTSRHGFQWSSTPPPSSRRRAVNILTEDSGLRNGSKTVSSIKDMFCLFINDDTTTVIIEETNRHLNRKNPETSRPISEEEFFAFIGILLGSGRNRTRKL
jgi:hypothetical protein